jgi:hypothetical protein
LDWDPEVVRNRAADLSLHAEEFTRQVLEGLDPSQMGLTWEPLRERAEQASHGSTDFGMLFIGFSSFIIIFN